MYEIQQFKRALIAAIAAGDISAADAAQRLECFEKMYRELPKLPPHSFWVRLHGGTRNAKLDAFCTEREEVYKELFQPGLRQKLKFSLRELILIITGICVILGLIRIAGDGGIFVLLALVMAAIVASDRRVRRRVTIASKLRQRKKKLLAARSCSAVV